MQYLKAMKEPANKTNPTIKIKARNLGTSTSFYPSGPVLTCFSAPCHPTRAVRCARHRAHAYRMMPGACDPLAWPIHLFRPRPRSRPPRRSTSPSARSSRRQQALYNGFDVILRNSRSIISYVPQHATRVLSSASCPCSMDAGSGLQPDAVTTTHLSTTIPVTHHPRTPPPCSMDAGWGLQPDAVM